MPYKSSGKRVLVKRKGKWVPHKTHPSEAAARKHASALNANVRHK